MQDSYKAGTLDNNASFAKPFRDLRSNAYIQPSVTEVMAESLDYSNGPELKDLLLIFLKAVDSGDPKPMLYWNAWPSPTHALVRPVEKMHMNIHMLESWSQKTLTCFKLKSQPQGYDNVVRNYRKKKTERNNTLPRSNLTKTRQAIGC